MCPVLVILKSIKFRIKFLRGVKNVDWAELLNYWLHWKGPLFPQQTGGSQRSGLCSLCRKIPLNCEEDAVPNQMVSHFQNEEGEPMVFWRQYHDGFQEDNHGWSSKTVGFVGFWLEGMAQKNHTAVFRSLPRFYLQNVQILAFGSRPFSQRYHGIYGPYMMKNNWFLGLVVEEVEGLESKVHKKLLPDNVFSWPASHHASLAGCSLPITFFLENFSPVCCWRVLLTVASQPLLQPSYLSTLLSTAVMRPPVCLSSASSQFLH